MEIQSRHELLDATRTLTMNANQRKLSSDRTRFDFANAVTKIFAFLSDLGFSQLEASLTIVRYRKGDLEVDVYHGRQSYELGFEVDRYGKKYSIGELIRATDAEAAARYRSFAATTQEGLIEGLVRLAEWAKRYAGRAIQDDPSFFALLEDQRMSWREAYALDVVEQQLRPKANEAFRLGNYQEAAELLERIVPRLSPAELKKLRYCKRSRSETAGRSRQSKIRNASKSPATC
jgi:hypothetical protein